MKTKKLSIAIALLAVAVIGTSCGNKQQKSSSDTTTEQTTSSALEIDSLLANAENLAGKEVTIEGVCTHTCKHGAKKIFLMGSDDTQVIRIEAGTLGAFDPKCVNSIVRVTGTLKEQRIDEAYLQNWEAQLKAQAAEKHGTGEAGCDTEKKARGETANTPEARIADFRAKIADRKASSGKEYLSFYFMEANSYEVSSSIRKWSRLIHRDLSFFFAGMVLIYAISGIVMNHRDTINPNFSIERKEYKIAEKLPGKEGMKRENVLTLLQPLGEEGNYTKHYFPKTDIMKVFLKGGSNLQVNVRTGEAVYESVTRRPLIGAMARLHYNPGQWWTYFADIFAVGLIIITLSGVIMLKGSKGIIGRGGIEMIVGIVIPILFLLFF